MEWECGNSLLMDGGSSLEILDLRWGGNQISFCHDFGCGDVAWNPFPALFRIALDKCASVAAYTDNTAGTIQWSVSLLETSRIGRWGALLIFTAFFMF